MRAPFGPVGSSRSRRRAPSWARATLIGALLAGPACLCACGPAGAPARDITVELSFDPAPAVGDTTCTIRLGDASGAPVTGAALEVEGNMNHAGMVPVFGTAVEDAPGTYRAPLEFTMGGDWFVIVRAELADGRALEEILDVPGVAVTGSEGESPACCPTSAE